MRKRNFFDDFAETHNPEPSATINAVQDPTPAAEVVEAPEPEQVPAPAAADPEPAEAGKEVNDVVKDE